VSLCAHLHTVCRGPNRRSPTGQKLPQSGRLRYCVLTPVIGDAIQPGSVRAPTLHQILGRGNFEIWWTKGDSSPRLPRCERRRKIHKTRRCNHLRLLNIPSNGQAGQPKLCWTRHSYRELSSWILRFLIGKNRLKADVLLIASHVFQQPMRFSWLAWKKRREGGFPISNEALGPPNMSLSLGFARLCAKFIAKLATWRWSL
jgi:hypothetical protein